MNPLSYIDDLLNNFTMYKVVLYGLLSIAVFTIFFGFLGVLPYNGVNLIGSLLLLAITCYIVNTFFSYLFHAPTNSESWFITAVILLLIMNPLHNLSSALFLFLAGTISMASKYLIAINKKHVFNPAVFGAFALSIFHHGAIWWIGSTIMAPIVVVIGLLVVRKIRKFSLFFSFFIISLVTIFLISTLHNSGGVSVVWQAITSWPLLFLGTIMLTEPSTMPPTQNLQMIYGAFVGFVMASQVHFGSYGMSAETALIIGNIYSYIVSSKKRLMLKLKDKKNAAPDIVHFTFKTPHKLAYAPGQYMEWTLPHSKADIRGNRRYFTIASSPTEKDLMIGVRINKRGSSFKRKLSNLEKDDSLLAAHISGDFVLPEDKKKKLVFIAGGIGVTPFRSMVKYSIDTKEKRDIILIYTAKNTDEFAYKELFDEAAKEIGLKTIYTVTSKESLPADWKGAVGRLNPSLIQTEIPDYKQRIFYVSGPNTLVSSTKSMLHSIGVPSINIKTDFFPGFV